MTHRSTWGVGGPYLHCLVQGGGGHPGQGTPKAAVQVCDGESVARPDVPGGRGSGGVHLQHTVWQEQTSAGGAHVPTRPLPPPEALRWLPMAPGLPVAPSPPALPPWDPGFSHVLRSRPRAQGAQPRPAQTPHQHQAVFAPRQEVAAVPCELQARDVLVVAAQDDQKVPRGDLQGAHTDQGRRWGAVPTNTGCARARGSGRNTEAGWTTPPPSCPACACSHRVPKWMTVLFELPPPCPVTQTSESWASCGPRTPVQCRARE